MEFIGDVCMKFVVLILVNVNLIVVQICNFKIVIFVVLFRGWLR
jgi:hypothetical protein